MYKSVDSVSFSLLNTGYVNLDTKWDFENVMSPFFRLYYITEGEAKVFHHNQEYILKPNYLYLIPSFTHSHYRCEAVMSQYYISALEVSDNGTSIFKALNFVYEIEADSVSLIYFKRILELNPNRTIVKDDPKDYDNDMGLKSFIVENKKLSNRAYLETSGLLKALVSKFVLNYKNTRISDQSKSKLSEVIHFIDVNLHTDITVKDLATFQNLNVDYFSRLFKEIYKVRPNEYIQKKRVERAQLLLLASTNSLQQIADIVGFNNVSYFSRVFKKLTQKSPLQYKKDELGM